MTTPLTDLFPARYRTHAYIVFAVIGLILGSVQVYCAATDTDVPTVVVGLLAVFAFLGAPLFGALAASNVNRP